MRYKEISSKFFYYVGVIIGIGFCIILLTGFGLMNFQKPDGFTLLIALLVISPFGLFMLYENTLKYIYASVDLEDRTFIYGNIFFQQVVNLEEVKVIKKRLFKRSTYKIQIGQKTYFVFTQGVDLKLYFDLKS